MRKLLALVTLMFAVSSGSQTPVPTEAELIACAKKIDVSKLDPTLPSQSLEEWLQVGPARVDQLAWYAGYNSRSDGLCGEPPDDFRHWALVTFRRNDFLGYVRLTLGTAQEGIVGPPKFEHAEVEFRPGGAVAVEEVGRLSDLPRTLDRPPVGAGLVAYTMKIDVSKLDPALPSQSLEEWLQINPARGDRLAWYAGINSCNDMPEGEGPPDGHPLCARVIFVKNGVVGYILLTIGCARTGIVEPPKFECASVEWRPGVGLVVEVVDKLSDLPGAIEKPENPKRH